MADIITHYALYNSVKEFPTKDTPIGEREIYTNKHDSMIGCALPDVLYMTGIIKEGIVHSNERINELKQKVFGNSRLVSKITNIIHGMENHNIVDYLSHDGNEFLERLRDKARKYLEEGELPKKISKSVLPDFIAETILGMYIKEKYPSTIDYIKLNQESFIKDRIYDHIGELVMEWRGKKDPRGKKAKKVGEKLRVIIDKIDMDDLGSIKGVARVARQTYGMRTNYANKDTWKSFISIYSVLKHPEKVQILSDVEKRIMDDLYNEGNFDKKLEEVFREMESKMMKRYLIEPQREETGPKVKTNEEISDELNIKIDSIDLDSGHSAQA